MFKAKIVIAIVVSSLLSNACGTRNTGGAGAPLPPAPQPQPAPVPTDTIDSNDPESMGEIPPSEASDENQSPEDGAEELPTDTGAAADRDPGPGRQPDPGSDPMDLELNTRIRVQIVDARTVERIAARHPDRPSHFAVGGRVLPSSAAMLESRNGTTICHSRLSGRRLRSGDVFDLEVVRSARAPGRTEGFFKSLALIGENRGTRLEIFCLKTLAPVSGEEASRALNGVVRFVK